MTDHGQLEYNALRATIRERGTARVYVIAGGFAVWSGLTIATVALAFSPLATLVPLLFLAAIFEAVFALHVAVERVGRYLYVFHEAETGTGPVRAPTTAAGPAAAGWEHAVSAFGRPKGSATADPIFSMLFLLAALFNIAPALVVEPTRQELIFVGGAHALFVVRLLVARETSRRQRAIDQARFEELKTRNN